MLELCASRQKPPSVSVCWLRQHASSQLAPPRATRSAPVAWAHAAMKRCEHGTVRSTRANTGTRAGPDGAIGGFDRRLYPRVGPLHRETAWLGVGLRAD